jgi:hypothetical protein
MGKGNKGESIYKVCLCQSMHCSPVVSIDFQKKFVASMVMKSLRANWQTYRSLPLIVSFVSVKAILAFVWRPNRYLANCRAGALAAA